MWMTEHSMTSVTWRLTNLAVCQGFVKHNLRIIVCRRPLYGFVRVGLLFALFCAARHKASIVIALRQSIAVLLLQYCSMLMLLFSRRLFLCCGFALVDCTRCPATNEYLMQESVYGKKIPVFCASGA